jgi:SOS-response transcriptional repressor LexA
MGEAMQKDFGKTIGELREGLHWSKQDLAEKTGLHRTYIHKIEKGETNPTLDVIEKLSQALGVSKIYLIEGGVSSVLGPGENHDRPQMEETVEVPFWGDVPCGPPTDVQQEVYLGTSPILRHLSGKGRYILRACGSSMNDIFKDGDLILVQYREGITLHEANGRVCTVLLNGESTAKRVIVDFVDHKPVNVFLQPENREDPSYKPITVDLEKDHLMITGFVLKVVDHDVS